MRYALSYTLVVLVLFSGVSGYLYDHDGAAGAAEPSTGRSTG